MSRSYKKNWSILYKSRNTKYYKRQASKKVRRYTNDISNGSSYNRLYDQYNICDGGWTIGKDHDLYKKRSKIP